MTLWERIKAVIGRRSTVSWGLLDPRLGEAFGIGETASGITVNGRVAENLSAAFACVQAISSAVAQVPVHIYRRTGNTRIEQPNHPFARLVSAGPNDNQTWPDFVEAFMASCLIRGNALAEIERDAMGQVSGLAFFNWDWVSVQLLPSRRLRFDVFNPFETQGNRRRLLPEEVLYLKDRSDDGFVGRSRLSRAAETIGAAAAASEFAGSFFRNSANPSLAIHPEHPIDEKGVAQLREAVRKGHTGSRNAGRIMVIDHGLKIEKLSFSPEDAELLETRRFNTEEICRIFQVPPPIVQDYSHNTFTNSETAGRWFSQFTVAPWVRKLEAVFNRAIFEPGSGYEIEFDLSGFLRGDPLQRWQAHQIALSNKVLTPNEVREVEGWNPRDGGDEFEEPRSPATEPREPVTEPEPAAA